MKTEERSNAAEQYVEGFHPAIKRMCKECFVDGAKWADEHPRKGLVDIEKACEWIKQNISRYLFNTGKLDEYIPTCSDKLYEDLKKAMEE